MIGMKCSDDSDDYGKHLEAKNIGNIYLSALKLQTFSKKRFLKLPMITLSNHKKTSYSQRESEAWLQ
jgi:hypothetical protein